jgi:hypothetical protein
METCDVAEDSNLPADLLARVNDADVVFFLGAGCSMEAPAKLPSAADLAQSLIERGFGNEGDSLEQVAEECARRGQNVLSEALPKAEWRAKPCNVAHRIIAQLSKEGLINEVVTTNWDTLIEHGIHRAGVPFTPVVNPQLLREGGLAGGVRVAKIHGCIDHPEASLRATADELQEWAAEWAKVLFEYLVRTRTFVFVGYSGAAASVTVTLAEIAKAGENAVRGYVVDPRGLESIADTEHGRAFLAALGGDHAPFIPMTSTDFFSALRVDVFPLLLNRPWKVCRGRIAALCQQTKINPNEIEAIAEGVLETWRQIGPDRAQVMLPGLLPGFVEAGLDDPYLPLAPNSEPLAYVWLAWALLLWAEASVIDTDVLYSTDEVRGGVSFLVMAAGGERRDIVGIQAATSYVESRDQVGTGIVALVFGDIGPLPEPQVVNASIARPLAGPSIVRPPAPKCTWFPAAELLSLFGKDADAHVVKARTLELLRDTANTLEE